MLPPVPLHNGDRPETHRSPSSLRRRCSRYVRHRLLNQCNSIRQRGNLSPCNSSQNRCNIPVEDEMRSRINISKHTTHAAAGMLSEISTSKYNAHIAVEKLSRTINTNHITSTSTSNNYNITVLLEKYNQTTHSKCSGITQGVIFSQTMRHRHSIITLDGVFSQILASYRPKKKLGSNISKARYHIMTIQLME